MIISTSDGRHTSKLTREERRKEIERKWDAALPQDHLCVQTIIDEIDGAAHDGDIGIESPEEIISATQAFHSVVHSHFEKQIVTIDEFVKDDYYMGHVGRYFWDTWFDDM